MKYCEISYSKSNSEVFGSEFGKTDFEIGLKTLKNINRDFFGKVDFLVKVNADVITDVSSQRSELTSAVNANVMLTSLV